MTGAEPIGLPVEHEPDDGGSTAERVRRPRAPRLCHRLWEQPTAEHYLGTVASVPIGPQRELIQRLWSRTTIDPDSGCWCWHGTDNGKGYATITVGGRRLYIHRVAYALLVGPLDPELEIDHVRARGCRHRNCWRPAHLQQVSHAENVLRGDSPPAIHARRTAHRSRERTASVLSAYPACAVCGNAVVGGQTDTDGCPAHFTCQREKTA